MGVASIRPDREDLAADVAVSFVSSALSKPFTSTGHTEMEIPEAGLGCGCLVKC
jgi:hypothetical protein